MTHIHSENVHDYADRQVRVFLDGTEMNANLITEANEDGGYIVITIPGKDGNIFVDPRSDEVRQVKLIGRVDITLDGADLTREQSFACSDLFHRRKYKVA